MAIATPKTTFSKEELENSFPMNLSRRLRGRATNALVEELRVPILKLENRKRRRRPIDQARWDHTLHVLLANLLAAALNKLDDSRFVAVSFDNNHYIDEDVSPTALSVIRDALFNLNLVEGQRGFYYLNYIGEDGVTRRTRLRATPELRSLLVRFQTDYEQLPTPPKALIKLKETKLRINEPKIRINEPKPDVGEIPDEVELSRQTIIAVNVVLKDCAIDLPPEAWERIKARLGNDPDRNSRKRAGDVKSVELHRQFRGTWERGGRLYGGWWINLPKTERPHLTINGNHTVELDFASLHPTILYARVGIELDFDPYTIPGLNTPEIRTLGKRTFNRLLNKKSNSSGSRARLRIKPEDKGILPDDSSYNKYVDRLIAHNQPIAHWFGADEGAKLQYEDSQVALSILESFTKLSIPILPIHDSFIVETNHRDRLKETMKDTFKDRFGVIPQIHEVNRQNIT